MPHTRLVAVGAVARDVLLGVPFYPQEDSKLRATSFHQRRGGNVGNTLEVLAQLLASDGRPASDMVGDGGESVPGIELLLVAALPSKASSSIDFIASSFEARSSTGAAGPRAVSIVESTPRRAVNMQYCLYRDDYDEPVTSYIISSEANMSRTIVNHNPLPEMTFREFCTMADGLLKSSPQGDTTPNDRLWFHFEGRIPDVTLRSMRYLRNHPPRPLGPPESNSSRPLMISVELEKPGREGLQDLAREADVVFYSRCWAEGEGHESAQECLRRQADLPRAVPDPSCAHGPRQRLLMCTWGSKGACGLFVDHGASSSARDGPTIVHSPAFINDTTPVVDTTGAGDTFIAGVLFLLLRPEIAGGSFPSLPLKKILDFANALAGHKILQQGKCRKAGAFITVNIGTYRVARGAAVKKKIEDNVGTTGVAKLWQLNVGSYASVQGFVTRVAALDRVEAVVANASVAMPDYEEMEGFKSSLTINMIGMFLLATLLLPDLQRFATSLAIQPHLTIVGSGAAFGMNSRLRGLMETCWMGWTSKPRSPWRTDQVSKLLQLYAVRELSRCPSQFWSPVVLNIVNSGLCKTELFRRLGPMLQMTSTLVGLLIARMAEAGSRNPLYAATAGPESHRKYPSACQAQMYILQIIWTLPPMKHGNILPAAT